MIDTHCHLNFDSFDENLVDVVDRAKEVGVEKIIVPGTNLSNSKKAVKISNDLRGVYSTVGIHPTENLENLDLSKVISNFDELIEENKKIVGIGEIGLDYYKNKSASRLQRAFLVEQIKLAKKHGLSVVIHSRQATDDILKVMKNVWDNNLKGRVLFHSCEARTELLEHAKKKKIYISIGGDITYDKEKQEFIKKVPLKLLLLETDSPFRTPHPLKKEGKYDNEPKNVEVILKFLSNMLGESDSKLEKITDSNAKEFFGI